MKKLPFILIILSFVFALAAVVIAIGGTMNLQDQADTLVEEIEEELEELDGEIASQPDLPEGFELNENTDLVSISPEDLGFTYLAPNEWGAFNLTFRPGHFKGSGTYSGSFAELDISYTATKPEFVPGRGGYHGDILGYRETSDGFEANFLDNRWNLIPERIVQGEIDTVNGSVLVVSTDHEAEGPVMFSGEEGIRFAIMNTPGGELPGGTFRAGPEVTRDEFRAFLESLEFLEAAE